MLKMDTFLVDGAPMKIFLIIQVRGSQGYTLIGSGSDEPNKNNFFAVLSLSQPNPGQFHTSSFRFLLVGGNFSVSQLNFWTRCEVNSNILHHVASSHFEVEIRTIFCSLWTLNRNWTAINESPLNLTIYGTQRVDCWQIPTFILLLSSSLSDRVHLIVLINSSSFINLYHSCASRAPHFTWCSLILSWPRIILQDHMSWLK